MSFKDLSSKTGTPMKPVPSKNSDSDAKNVESDPASRIPREESSE